MQLVSMMILFLSIVAQSSAAVIAWRQLRLTGAYRFAWVIMSFALMLMIERRVVPFWEAATGHPINFINEIFGLVISVLMLVGVYT